MTKKEIAQVKNNELITEYVNSYAMLMMNYNEGKGIYRLQKHCQDLEAELLKREILQQSDIDKLNV